MSTLETGLCGELFKAGETNSNFKLRWFHLHPNGELTWSETVEQAPKGTVPMRGATVQLEAEPVKAEKDGLRYGFVITPAGAPRTYKLQASSVEERRLWADALEAAAHPEVQSSQLVGHGRVDAAGTRAVKGLLRPQRGAALVAAGVELRVRDRDRLARRAVAQHVQPPRLAAKGDRRRRVARMVE